MEQSYPIRDKIEYIIAFVNEFGQRFGLTDSQAYRYLKTYDAISAIDQYYGALHTQDFRGNVDDVATLLLINASLHGIILLLPKERFLESRMNSRSIRVSLLDSFSTSRTPMLFAGTF